MSLAISVLLAHPGIEHSSVNRALYSAAIRLEHVNGVDLYAQYPDFRIDVATEQQRLLASDVIVFQFPLFWYSTPSLLKEWQDRVLQYGFAYGQGGNALQGKTLICAVTAGGSENTYCAKGYNHFTLRQLLQPIEQTASLTGMHYLPPFALFSSRETQQEARIRNHVNDYQKLLNALAEQRFNHEAACQLDKLNGRLDELISTTTAEPLKQ